MGKRQNILLKLILISEIFMLLNIDVVNPTLKEGIKVFIVN